MHEFSICQALITQVEQIAISHGALKVQSVKLRIGSLSGVELPLLEHAYPFASAGTLVEGSTLEIERAPLKVNCEACGLESEVKANLLTCRMCGSCLIRVVSGEELTLMSVELITT
ncbi:hydrogenase nickel incorporation protein HypA/HybF [Nitrosospira multiformis ATCC 25196]|uniref:Hydrogenase maturation factor HypA n=2 Tax=Nitrosospira multiformis (strain ATCC 25196 / NCIMB 11849 / C 71) TaxID=323848 RepID=HYPA_NITMU|nr:hydrogenase maturation nickel metallochaperone HypA [Nitrosospira multiformis]Q2Y8F8.1 RecName: Full=Hydrogenase maturation factor HypA [Nitrosospira multiformis ATCC 25196]ABB74963.1 Hydrogenase expression/synthesis, HypA [Nitrosospira multiformis ATCC 25196]SEG00404.1 hydrogenase nickel incorporation protein HypA/HybF [Nitrosospira multiformis ATCC 25196]